MQNYLAVLFISNNSVHERYGTNLFTCEYLVWTDTYYAHVATVSAGQTGDGRLVIIPWHCESGMIDPKNVVIEKVWRNKANKDFNKQLIEQTRS